MKGDGFGSAGRHVRRRWAPAVAAVLAIGLVVSVVAAFLLLGERSTLLQKLPGRPAHAPLPAGTVQRSLSGTYWGAFLPGADRDQSVIKRFASDAGRQPAIVSIYQQWWGQPSFPAAAARWLEDRGAVPLVVWEPWQPGLKGTQKVDQPAYRLSVIARGGFDGYLRRYADQVRAYAGPLFLEPFHEMNGNWYPWGGTVNGNTTGDYVLAWRHVHDVFQREGATNVTWTWTVNAGSVPNTTENLPDRYWPGAEYVDWVGLDAYNWGTAPGTRWQTVAQTFAPGLAVLQGFGKPVILAETACTEPGGDKAAWISTLFASLTGAYRDVVGAAVWFNEPIPGFDWRTSTSARAQAAFVAGVARPGILSAGQVLASPAPHRQ
jgi:Glycosyl hydrolase family 26